MTRSHEQLFALCSTRNGQLGSFPSYGRIEAIEWDADPQSRAGIRGLLWGEGDPAVAGLDWQEWAIVRIDDASGPVEIPHASDASKAAAVKFQFGTVIFLGDRRGAIETLIQHGANPDRMQVRLRLPGEDGIANAESYGVAIAGNYGIARGGDHSHALTSVGGLAIAGDLGFAQTCGNGIAAAGSLGSALGLGESLAIARGFRARAEAGDGGVAVATEEMCSLSVGNGGLAIALRGAERVIGGRHSIAIIRHAAEGWTTVTLGEGSVAILDFRKDANAPPSLAVASFGPDDLEPQAPYVCWGGVFQKMDMSHESRERRSAQRDRIAGILASERAIAAETPIAYGKPIEETIWPLERPLGTDTIVLCNMFYDDEMRLIRDRGEVSASHWNPDPASFEGILGLAWGSGNSKLAARHLFGDEFSLVRVAESVTVPLSDPEESGELVKFARGEIVLRGSLGEVFAALAGMGADPRKFPGEVIFAGDQGRVRAPAFGVARAGRKGLAVAGDRGDAQAGPDGVAIVTGNGLARADSGGIAVAWGEGLAIAGNRGVAVSVTKRHGKCEAGAEGLAIAMGTRMASAKAGRGGAAILRCSGTVRAGDDGIAYGSPESLIFVGRDGVAVSNNGELEGGPGSLLVLFGPGGKFKTAVVDEAGNVPRDFADWKGEVLRARSVDG